MPQKKIGYSAKRSSTSSFSSSKRRQVGFKNYKKGVSIMDHSFKAVLGATSTARRTVTGANSKANNSGCMLFIVVFVCILAMVSVI